MAKFEDLTGRTFGYWKVIERADNNACGSARWLCECKCGNFAIRTSQNLKNAKQGCRKCFVSPMKTHGGKGTRLYEIWRHMIYRCEIKSNQAYDSYGGRGISVCEEWHDFEMFRKWALQNGYEETKSIDRKNVDGNYEPGNCRWTDSKTQMNNRRNTPHYEHDGKSMTMSEWSEILGIPRSTIYNRMTKQGMSFEEAILTK